MNLMAVRPFRTLYLGIMAKYWRPGRVKTRLGASIGLEKAARIHHAFCRHLVATLGDAADCRSLVFSPPEHRQDFIELQCSADPPAVPDSPIRTKRWLVEPQAEGDLGQRMKAWFAACATRVSVEGHQREGDAVLIGADCPLVNLKTIDQCRTLLAQHDVVLGPALDGGYYLIAFRDAWCDRYATLLERMPWSEPSVFERTISRAEDLGLSVGTLQPLEDIDTIDELQRLRSQLSDESLAPGLRRLACQLEDILLGNDDG